MLLFYYSIVQKNKIVLSSYHFCPVPVPVSVSVCASCVVMSYNILSLSLSISRSSAAMCCYATYCAPALSLFSLCIYMSIVWCRVLLSVVMSCSLVPVPITLPVSICCHVLSSCLSLSVCVFISVCASVIVMVCAVILSLSMSLPLSHLCHLSSCQLLSSRPLLSCHCPSIICCHVMSSCRSPCSCLCPCLSPCLCPGTKWYHIMRYHPPSVQSLSLPPLAHHLLSCHVLFCPCPWLCLFL